MTDPLTQQRTREKYILSLISGSTPNTYKNTLVLRCREEQNATVHSNSLPVNWHDNTVRPSSLSMSTVLIALIFPSERLFWFQGLWVLRQIQKPTEWREHVHTFQWGPVMNNYWTSGEASQCQLPCPNHFCQPLNQSSDLSLWMGTGLIMKSVWRSPSPFQTQVCNYRNVIPAEWKPFEMQPLLSCALPFHLAPFQTGWATFSLRFGANLR